MKSGKGLVEFAKGKIGTPYFYGAKMQILTEEKMQSLHKQYPSNVTLAYMALARLKKQVGKINTDCSGLIGAFREKQIGSSQLYQTASVRLAVKDYKKWANGVVCWRKGHVGVFFHNGTDCFVIEAKGINYGTVLSEFDPSKWSAGLCFVDLEYDFTDTAEHSYRQINSYPEPTRTLKKGMRGEDVKWLQWELCEAGFEADIMAHGGIDGDFGKTTLKCVKAFQKDAGLTVDGIVGLLTRCALKESC